MTAAHTAAEWLGIPVSGLDVLHRSNNVVVRIGQLVLNVGGNGDRPIAGPTPFPSTTNPPLGP